VAARFLHSLFSSAGSRSPYRSLPRLVFLPDLLFLLQEKIISRRKNAAPRFARRRKTKILPASAKVSWICAAIPYKHCCNPSLLKCAIKKQAYPVYGCDPAYLSASRHFCFICARCLALMQNRMRPEEKPPIRAHFKNKKTPPGQ
jgi:hypothetical protein